MDDDHSQAAFAFHTSRPYSRLYDDVAGANSICGFSIICRALTHETSETGLTFQHWIHAVVMTMLTLALNSVGAGPAVASPDAIFTVGNYPVEARAKNAVTAKKTALSDGRQAAFRSLLKRLVPVTAYSQVRLLGDIDPAQLIDGVSVRSERNSATEYIASLDFTFQPDAVRRLLRQRGVPFVDEQAPTTVIIPIVRQSKNAKAETDQNWTATWRALDLKNSITPLRVETLKPVIHVDTLRMALQGDGNAERILATEYQSERVLLAVATIDKAAKKINVTLVGTDGVAPVNWTQSYKIIDDDIAYTLELVASVTLGVIEGRWKAQRVARGGGLAAFSQPPADVTMQVAFSGLHEWNIIRRKLLETPGVEQVRINSVSARGAAVALSFPGGGAPLSQALAIQGLSLMQTGSVWVLALRY